MIKKKKIVIIISVIILLVFAFIITDYIRTKNNLKPIFSILIVNKENKQYLGLGYKIINCNNTDESNSMHMGLYYLNADKVCNSSDGYDIKLCKNNMRELRWAEEKYYKNEESLNFPFKIEIKEKHDCQKPIKLYYSEVYTNIYLYCLDEVTIRFSNNKKMPLKDALEQKKVTMEEILNLIPYKNNIGYKENHYIHSKKHGFTPNGISIYEVENFHRYIIGPTSMCDEIIFGGIRLDEDN